MDPSKPIHMDPSKPIHTLEFTSLYPSVMAKAVGSPYSKLDMHMTKQDQERLKAMILQLCETELAEKRRG